MKGLRAALIVITLVGCLAPAAGRAQTASTPRFEDASCPFKPGFGIEQGKNLRCGYLIVPEDRSLPNGPTIKLAVAIFKSPENQPAPDPVVFLAGGPGGSAVGAAPHITALNLSAWTGNRDLILIDQRGTGYSQPKLDCPEVMSEGVQALAHGWSKAREATQEARAVTTCRARLAGKGINLAAYTTAANAQDIADLRVALGYPAINLYGGSYGTRLGLAVMRDAPQGIRSVVLDAVLPPDVNTLTAPLQSAARDFKLLFSACAHADTCNANHPHLASDFSQVVRRLDKKPVTIRVALPGQHGQQKVVLTGEAFVDTLFGALYDSSLIVLLPEMITRAARGKYGLTAQIASQALQTGTGISYGMYLSVDCSDDAYAITDRDIDAAAHALPAAVRADFAAGRHRELRECQIWNVKPTAPQEKQPVVSDIPTMLMVGEFDPITPPPYAAEVAKTLSHSYLFVYPGLGHTTRFSAACPDAMAAAFFDHPDQKPDDSCIASMTEPFQ